MFTGIIKHIAKVTGVQRQASGMSIWISAVVEDAEIGDSIAVNGVCLTVEKISNGKMRFFVTNQTLKNTTLGRLKVSQAVNIEPALKLGDKLGGHIVSGHIDCMGKLIIKKRDGQTMLMRVRIPFNFKSYLRNKGSIAVDGVSLTIQRVVNDVFEVVIIPETLNSTTLGQKRVGDYLNIEFEKINTV